jgi:hypothetical protein
MYFMGQYRVGVGYWQWHMLDIEQNFNFKCECYLDFDW